MFISMENFKVFMKIDYIKNPLAIVERVVIPYDDGLELEGRIVAHVEEGFNEATWFDGEVRYPTHNCEIGGVQTDEFYQDLRRGAPTLEGVEEKLALWCMYFGLEISSHTLETVGIKV